MSLSKKNIIFPIEFDHFTGGMIHSVVALAQSLKIDYNVYFLAHKGAEVFKLDSEIRALVLEKPWSISVSSPLKTISTFFEVKRLLKNFDLDNTLIFTNNVGSELIFSGFGFFPVSFRRIFVSRGGDYLGKTGWVVRRGFRSVYHFVCTSTRQINILNKGGIKKNQITLIHNGVAGLLENFVFTFDSREVIQLTVVGYINAEKNQKLIIDALYLLKKNKQFKYCLNIYGTDTSKLNIYTKELKALINDYDLNENVVFQGFEKNKDLIYCNTHILISSSLSEGFGRTVAEAMAYGIPCIGLIESGGLLDIITDKYDGFLIKNDKYELVNVISMLTDNSVVRNNISINAKNTYNQKFTVDKMCEKYKMLINEYFN